MELSEQQLEERRRKRSEYYHLNKESEAANNKRWRDKNPHYVSPWKKNNKDRINATRRLWRANNPDKVYAKNHNRRIKVTLTPFPALEWKDRLDRFGDYCPYCDTKGHKLTLDHVIPITLGGTNDIWNLVPCCISCNCSKNNKPLWEWKPGFNFLHLMEYF